MTEKSVTLTAKMVDWPVGWIVEKKMMSLPNRPQLLCPRWGALPPVGLGWSDPGLTGAARGARGLGSKGSWVGKS
jgi:hypothetical protein